jgi:hypothetical protein
MYGIHAGRHADRESRREVYRGPDLTTVPALS